MTVHFSTTQYEFSHGHRPRGRGAWAFFFNAGQAGEPFWVADSNYGDAKKAAATEARRRGKSTVYVGS